MAMGMTGDGLAIHQGGWAGQLLLHRPIETRTGKSSQCA